MAREAGGRPWLLGRVEVSSHAPPGSRSAATALPVAVPISPNNTCGRDDDGEFYGITRPTRPLTPTSASNYLDPSKARGEKTVVAAIEWLQIPSTNRKIVSPTFH